jgi:lactoylglutathione lyase
MLIKKITKLLLFILFFNTIHAQDNSIAFNHLALSVKDLNRSASFYKEILMLPEITNLSARDDIRWFSLSGGRELHLIANNEKVVSNRSVHIAFTSASFDGILKRINELKIPYSDFAGKQNAINIRADGIKQIYFQDPDGYWIEINSVGDTHASVQQIKNEIWQLEENYWKYVKEKDFKSYLSLWDENFIGYPSTNKIGGKKNITDWITEMFKENKNIYSYELTRHVENVFDDIVIVLYDAIHLWKNDNGEVIETSTYKLTHTWKKTDKGWVIIGGMGAKK